MYLQCRTELYCIVSQFLLRLPGSGLALLVDPSKKVSLIHFLVVSTSTPLTPRKRKRGTDKRRKKVLWALEHCCIVENHTGMGVRLAGTASTPLYVAIYTFINLHKTFDLLLLVESRPLDSSSSGKNQHPKLPTLHNTLDIYFRLPFLNKFLFFF